MTLTITVREAKAVLAEMKKLTPARPRQDDDTKLSLKEVIFFMAPEFATMLKRDFTLKELADGLEIQNIPVKPSTLNRYLNEYKTSQSEAEAAAKISQEEMGKTPADSEAEVSQESAETAEAREAEIKTRETSRGKGTSPQSETAGEKSEIARGKSENLSPFFRSLIGDSQEQNPPQPPHERQGGFRM